MQVGTTITSSSCYILELFHAIALYAVLPSLHIAMRSSLMLVITNAGRAAIGVPADMQKNPQPTPTAESMRIPMKSPGRSEMMAPVDSDMMSPRA